MAIKLHHLHPSHDDEEVYKTAEIEAWHPLPMPPEEEK